MAGKTRPFLVCLMKALLSTIGFPLCVCVCFLIIFKNSDYLFDSLQIKIAILLSSILNNFKFIDKFNINEEKEISYRWTCDAIYICVIAWTGVQHYPVYIFVYYVASGTCTTQQIYGIQLKASFNWQVLPASDSLKTWTSNSLFTFLVALST